MKITEGRINLLTPAFIIRLSSFRPPIFLPDEAFFLALFNKYFLALLFCKKPLGFFYFRAKKILWIAVKLEKRAKIKIG